MRARVYDFIWIMFTFPFVLLWLTFGGSGWLFIALIIAVATLRAFVFVLQVVAYSPKIISDSLSNSTDGKSFDHCDALGEDTVYLEHHTDKEGQALPLKAAAYPAVTFYEPGAGEWGLAKKWGGNEHGFIIVADDLILQLSDGGNIALLGPTVTLRPVHVSMLQLLRRVKPTDADPRRILPKEWWDRLNKHPRFNVKKSAVHVILDPGMPIITTRRLAGVPTPILRLPGRDATKDRKAIPPLDFLLTDVFGDKSPMIDLRPEMRLTLDARLEAARERMGLEIDIRDTRIQNLEAMITAQNAIELPMTERDMFRGKVAEAVAGKEETGERVR